MKNLSQFLSLLLLLTVFACGRSSNKKEIEIAGGETVVPTTQQNASQSESIERKLIKEGQVRFETNQLSATREIVFDAVKKYKAYISSDQEFNYSSRKSNTIVIRVPSNNFDNLFNEATKGVDRFEHKEIEIKDVTEEFLDVQARLKTKKALELRYIDLLKQAQNVTEILEIEKQIEKLRSEIESVEGRLKYLQDKVSFSTLNMTFYESIPNETAFGGKFKKGFKNGWDNLIWFFVALINIWPFILLALGLIFGIRFYRKKN